MSTPPAKFVEPKNTDARTLPPSPLAELDELHLGAVEIYQKNPFVLVCKISQPVSISISRNGKNTKYFSAQLIDVRASLGTMPIPHISVP